MKSVVIGAHLEREDVDPVASAIDAGPVVLSGYEVADDQPLGDRELLVRVAAVRARLLERATFIAIRYGLTVTSPSDAASKCAAHADRWRRVLSANRDRVEMTLKVAAASSTARPTRADFATGGDYLRALHASVAAAAPDEAFRAAAEAAFTRAGAAWKWVHRDDASVEAAVLVARHDVDAIAAAGAELKERFPSVPFLLSGPWPLEVFADADHE